MPVSQYSVTQLPVSTLITWINSGEIAIPEIQRPFVWNTTKVRNLLDSLFNGYPIGYLIVWRNPDVRLKNGEISTGKRILIDGQQRITAIMASMLGVQVVTKNYQNVHIRIAFHPIEQRFEVLNPAIQKDPSWISDISIVFDSNTSLFNLVNEYCKLNQGIEKDIVFQRIEALRGIVNNLLGVIELNPDLDIDTVTDIFIRVNSEGTPLSQADFAMSKIAVNEIYGGDKMRKAIDFFCHIYAQPEFYDMITQDEYFMKSDFFPKFNWLKRDVDNLYQPSYSDMLRVAFMSEFQRGRLRDLVALLSGRNFETRQFEEEIVKNSFSRLQTGIMHYINENNFKKFNLIIRSTGFVNKSMITSMGAVDFAYTLYLNLRKQRLPNNEIERIVRRWYIMSILTGRYSGSPESTFDLDMRQISAQGAEQYLDSLIRGGLSDAFWDTAILQNMNTSVARSPLFKLYQAAQVNANDHGFVSKDITVRDLISVKSDVHHIFPREYLKKYGFPRGQYNQIANYVITQNEINISIGDTEPSIYFKELNEQCSGGEKKYGNITNIDGLKKNLSDNCIPSGIENMKHNQYIDFLVERRRLMAEKIKNYFFKL